MAETDRTPTTEDYTHEEAIARIDALEEAIEEALEALEAHKLDEATEILENVIGEGDEEEEGPDDEEDDEEDE